MKNIKLLVWLIFCFPALFIVSCLAGPFFCLCVWAGQREDAEKILDNTGEAIKEGLIKFVEGDVPRGTIRKKF